MKISALYFVVVLGLLQASRAGCITGYKTTIVVKGCNDVPIKGLEIELTLRCQSDHLKKQTDETGKAEFSVRWSDISEKKIGGVLERKMAGGAAEDKDVTVTVQVCH